MVLRHWAKIMADHTKRERSLAIQRQKPPVQARLRRQGWLQLGRGRRELNGN